MSDSEPMAAEIECAAKWWRSRVESSSAQDNGDPEQSALATLVSLMMPTPTQEQAEVFECELRTQLQVCAESGGFMHLGVDYGPGLMLREAIEASGVNPQRLPIKTNMWIKPGSVRVSWGYRAPRVEIFATLGGTK